MVTNYWLMHQRARRRIFLCGGMTVTGDVALFFSALLIKIQLHAQHICAVTRITLSAQATPCAQTPRSLTQRGVTAGGVGVRGQAMAWLCSNGLCLSILSNGEIMK